MSNEHKLYLRKIKKTNFIVRFFRIAIIVFFLILWEYLSSKNIINAFIFSSPRKVVSTIINLYSTHNLFNHIFITIYETLISFVLGTLMGFIIASILWRFDIIARILDPYLTILNSLPKVALGPIIIIWAGASMKSIIIMALLISVIITVINIHQSFKEINENKIKLLKSFSATKSQIYFKLLLPGSLQNIISTLKINVSMSLIGVIMGEFLVSKSGVGYLIMYGSQVFNLSLLITGVALLSLLATIMYYLILLFEKK